MNITLDDLILKFVDQIIHFIDILPLSKDIKTTLKYTVATDFHDAWQFYFIDDQEFEVEVPNYSFYLEDPDDPKFLLYKRTRGINCEDRADEYLHDFIRGIANFNYDEIENYLFRNTDLFFKMILVNGCDEEYYLYERIYKIIDAPLSGDKISWRQWSKFDFLKSYNLHFIQDSDIDHYVQNILGYDFPAFHDEIAFDQQLPRTFDYLGELLKKLKQNEYAVEEFENVFCREAAAMYHKLSGGLNPDLDAQNINAYFEKFIYRIRHETTIDKKADDFESESEKIEFLEISDYQFHLYLPENRREPIIEKFLRFYYFPGKPPKVISPKTLNFISVLIDKYGKNFDILKDRFEYWMSDSNNVNITPKSLRELKKSLLKVKNDTAIMQERIDQKAIKKTNYFEFCEYYDYWVNGTATLGQWESHKNYDIVQFVRQFPLSEDIIAGIKSHRLGLYYKYVENIFNNDYKNRFEQISVISDKPMIAKSYAGFINMLIIGETDEHKGKLFNPNIPFEDWGKIAIQLNNIVLNTSESDENYNIHHPDCYAQAQAIFMYKEHLADFLSTTEPIMKSTKNTVSGRMKPPKPQKPIPLAFTYKMYSTNIPKVTEMCNLLKNVFIDKSTDLLDFRRIVSNTPPKKPTIWIGTMEELVYLVRLINTADGVFAFIPKNIWKLVVELFVDENGDKINYKKLKWQKLPTLARQDLLEKAVAKLK